MAKATEALGAGDFNRIIRFDKHIVVDDGAGNQIGDEWVEQFRRNAAVQPLRGGEGLIADRLAGLGPAIIVVRYDASTVTIKPEWRAVQIECDGAEVVYAIRDVRDIEDNRRHITLLCEFGSPA